jgi:hypothetical protein
MEPARNESTSLNTELPPLAIAAASGGDSGPKRNSESIAPDKVDSTGSFVESVEFSLLDKLIFKLDFFFPNSFSQLDVAASLVRNAVHHRTTKQYYSLDDRRRLRAFRLVNSQGFRKTAIVCALILAVLPTIEVPVSVAAPCWLSFALELFCYSVFTLRLYLEHLCYKSSWTKNPWFCSLNLSIVLCWIDVITTMAIIGSSGGNWLSFNNCGMPELGREARSASWIYVIGRFSRYVRHVPPSLTLACGSVVIRNTLAGATRHIYGMEHQNALFVSQYGSHSDRASQHPLHIGAVHFCIRRLWLFCLERP